MQLIKAIKTLVPDFMLAPIIAERSRRHQHSYLEELGITGFAEEFISKHGLAVRYGPFAGLKYTEGAARNRLIVPKLLGTYEQDLHEIIRQVQKTKYDLIVDIGCAEGYYTTGFALTTSADIVAFDAEKYELAFARQLAEHNNVADRIEFRGWCTSKVLRQLTMNRRRAFILSDCEGYEATLFDEATIDALRNSDLLIELHGDAKSALMPLFSRHHALQIIEFVRTYDADREELNGYSPAQREKAVDECRGTQEWLYAQAKSQSA